MLNKGELKALSEVQRQLVAKAIMQGCDFEVKEESKDMHTLVINDHPCYYTFLSNGKVLSLEVRPSSSQTNLFRQDDSGEIAGMTFTAKMLKSMIDSLARWTDICCDRGFVEKVSLMAAGIFLQEGQTVVNLPAGTPHTAEGRVVVPAAEAAKKLDIGSQAPREQHAPAGYKGKRPWKKFPPKHDAAHEKHEPTVKHEAAPSADTK